MCACRAVPGKPLLGTHECGASLKLLMAMHGCRQVELQGCNLPETGEVWWDSSGGWSPSVTGAVGCSE